MSKLEKYQDDGIYQIRIMGNLGNEWSGWLQGMQVSSSKDGGKTTITGHITDQARLRGILNKIWDLNLILISVHRIKN